MRPALDALARRCRTISYSLCGDFGSDAPFDRGLGFENFTRQLDRVLDKAGLERAAICGVSYGGFIAVRYAAARPQRVSSLILASSPAPGWSPTEQQQRYVAHPWLSAPMFALTAPARLMPEIRSARGSWPAAVTFAARHALRVLAAPAIPPLMARRVTLAQQQEFARDCALVEAPTLVLTGEDALDRVVPARITRRYETLIAGARGATFERTGHIGLITRPDRFAEIVCDFVGRTVGRAS
jgi:pimeloyl-ACP methyl ester carboxylesterase